MSMLVVFRSLVADAAVTGDIVTLVAPFSFATAWTDDSCVDGGTSALSVWASAAFALSGPSRAEVTTVIRSKPLRMAPRRSDLIVIPETWLHCRNCFFPQCASSLLLRVASHVLGPQDECFATRDEPTRTRDFPLATFG